MVTNGTVGVVGLGRFGCFWAGMLAEHMAVIATSRSGPRPLPPGVRYGTMEEVCAQSAIFLCVSISSLAESLRHIAPMVGPNTVVLDTCSVKALPARYMLELLPAANPLIATHPMFGPDSAGERRDPLPIITYPLRADDVTYRAWTARFAAMELRVVEMDPDAHDREAAFTQGVTHLLGRVLNTMKLEASPIATLGYRRLLQVMEQTCNDPLQLFLDLQRYNPYTRAMREQFRHAFHEVEELLADRDSPVGRP